MTTDLCPLCFFEVNVVLLRTSFFGTLTLMHLTTNPLRPKDSCSVWLCFIEMIHLWVFPEKCKWMWWKLTYSKPTFQSIIHRYMIYVRYIYPLHVGYSFKMNGSGNVFLQAQDYAKEYSRHFIQGMRRKRPGPWGFPVDMGGVLVGFLLGYPYHPCMVYLPTFTVKINQMQVYRYTIHGSYGIWIRPLIK